MKTLTESRRSERMLSVYPVASRVSALVHLSLFFLTLLLFVYSSFLPLEAKPCINCPKKQTGLDPYSGSQDNFNPLGSVTAQQALQGNAQNTMLQSGTGNTTLQIGTESTLLQGGAEGTLLQANVERDGGPINILFLIDSSQSMKESLSVGDGHKEKKMEAAKRVLQEALSRIPNEINLGLRVFGNGFRGDFSDCQQSTLLVPIGRNNRRSIIEAARNMAPYGLTPLTYALMQAEQDLRYCQGPKTVILISDGAETCGGDPCAYIERLSRIGIKMKIDIVGVGLRKDKAAQEQLNCVAQKSGGKYYDANTSAELVDSITNSVKQALSGKVLTKMKTPVINDIMPADLAPAPDSGVKK